ncbi:MAG TPA: hypothetical protein VJB12_00360 [Candidatus Nanoarchaeia archaeon]|nr:hypothetical protein [Candidatus Nanoarchaeia archaeon]
MQKLMQRSNQRESVKSMRQKACPRCLSPLSHQDCDAGVALVCQEDGCENNWTRDGAEILLMLR